MTVPALDTSIIGAFAYLQPATSVVLSDVLPYFHTFIQHAEYVDGVWRVYDNGGSTGYYCDVYIRIRTDGWIMAFFPNDANQASPCWNGWTLGEYLNRGDMVWWGYRMVYAVNPVPPPTDSTRLARVIYEAWTHLAANSDNPGYSFSYTNVDYYDYELTSGTVLHIFGDVLRTYSPYYQYDYYYFTCPVGTTIYKAYMNYAFYTTTSNMGHSAGYVNGTQIYGGHSSAGYYSAAILSYLQSPGTINTLYLKVRGNGYWAGNVQGIVLYANG